MKYRDAKLDDLGSVFSIAQANIRDIYPFFYPQAAVQWYADQHGCEAILADITAGRVRLLEERGTAVGTATIDGNRLLRVFVAPEQQRKGYGTRLLKLLEDEVGRAWSTVVLDSSLPAGHFFQARGYRTRSHELYDIEDKHGMLLATLAWEVMEKRLRPAEGVASEAAKAVGSPSASASAAAQEPEAAVEVVTESEEAATGSEEATPRPDGTEASSGGAVTRPDEKTASAGSPEPAAQADAAPPATAASEGNAPEEGAATITISSGTADVMRQLPQMPF